MKRKSVIAVALFLVVSIAACVLTFGSVENPKCSIISLVLEEEMMPEGWRNKWAILPPALDTLGAQEARRMIMQKGDGAAGHTVYQYSNRWLATLHFRFEKELFFPSVGWKWSRLEGVNSLPLHADQLQLKCGDSNDPHLGNSCTAVLRYGPYISDFSSSIQEGVMSTEEFKEIVLKIDELFSLCED